MTFKDFTKLTKSQGNYKIKDLPGRKIGIDASVKIKQAMTSIKYGKQLKSPSGHVTSHIKILFNNIIEFTKLHIQQIWIFDNNTKKAHKSVEAKRRHDLRKGQEQKRDEFKLRVNQFNDRDDLDEKEVEEFELLKRSLITLETTLMGSFYESVLDLKKMLKWLGISYIVAPDGIEAEHVGATLSYYGYIDYFITTDPDYLLYAAGLQLSNPSEAIFRMLKKVSRTQTYDVYELDAVLKNMNVTLEEFMHVAIYMGIDAISHDSYSTTSGIKGVGIKRVIDIVKGNKKPPKNADLKDYHLDAVDVFKYQLSLKSIIIYPKIPLNDATLKLNAVELENWLVIDKGFNKEMTMEKIKELIKMDY